MSAKQLISASVMSAAMVGAWGQVWRCTAKDGSILYSDQPCPVASKRHLVIGDPRTQLDAAVDRLEATYPALNPRSPNYDQAVIDEVMATKTLYESRGLTAPAAITAAAEEVIARHARKISGVTRGSAGSAMVQDANRKPPSLQATSSQQLQKSAEPILDSERITESGIRGVVLGAVLGALIVAVSMIRRLRRWAKAAIFKNLKRPPPGPLPEIPPLRLRSTNEPSSLRD